MGREFTATFTSSLVLLLCSRSDTFVSNPSAAGKRPGCGHQTRPPLIHPTFLSRPLYLSARHRARESHASSSSRDGEPECSCDPKVQRFPRSSPAGAADNGPTSYRFRVLRGGRKNTLGDSSGGLASRPEPDLVDVCLDQGTGSGGGGGGERSNSAQNIGDFLFLVRSSQPGSIGEELQRRGIRVFPEEAFIDAEDEEAGGAERSAAAVDGAAGQAGGRFSAEEISRFSWARGTPLPLDTPVADLPRDEGGRIRLVVWDPCGPDHPLIRATGGEPSEKASIEVLNFRPAEHGGGCSRGYGKDFDKSRSAVVFRDWFTADQQQVIADAIAAQMFNEEYGEEPNMPTDREHFPLLRDRAALAAVGDGMLSALSSERFSAAVGGREPPVPTRANREFNAVCYGAEAKMQKHKDTWKEWTLIVSIGNAIPFDLGTSQASPDVRLELSSGEGLLFNGYELFHEVHQAKEATAPTFWGTHALCVKGGFARVGFLSMKSFNSKGVSTPTWGPERMSTD